ncbi:hypothetical protein ACFP81_11280 [Deinococcus lacus]|uniref:Uncharacterized protein n=1 Tax=Deinococcus lacus TaxID=392561 RepID=A0ABW1YH25_9DEIO
MAAGVGTAAGKVAGVLAAVAGGWPGLTLLGWLALLGWPAPAQEKAGEPAPQAQAGAPADFATPAAPFLTGPRGSERQRHWGRRRGQR